jgi:hypothetical protein
MVSDALTIDHGRIDCFTRETAEGALIFRAWERRRRPKAAE